LSLGILALLLLLFFLNLQSEEGAASQLIL
jgi:hypothetical protein